MSQMTIMNAISGDDTSATVVVKHFGTQIASLTIKRDVATVPTTVGCTLTATAVGLDVTPASITFSTNSDLTVVAKISDNALVLVQEPVTGTNSIELVNTCSVAVLFGFTPDDIGTQTYGVPASASQIISRASQWTIDATSQWSYTHKGEEPGVTSTTTTDTQVNDPLDVDNANASIEIDNGLTLLMP